MKMTYDSMIKAGVPKEVAEEMCFTGDHPYDVNINKDGTITVSTLYSLRKFKNIYEFVEDTIYTLYRWKEEELDSEEDSRSCSDCPPEECNGHCMSCYYRTV